MIIWAEKGKPTVFTITHTEYQEQQFLLDSLFSTMEVFKSDTNYQYLVYKGFSNKQFYGANEVLPGEFVLPYSFFGDCFDICEHFTLYHTKQGFLQEPLPTGRYLDGLETFFTEPIAVGDIYNNKLVRTVYINFNTSTSIGEGYVRF